MTCDEARKWFTAYIRDELDPILKNEIAEHLARCERCRRDADVERLLLSGDRHAPAEPPINRELITEIQQFLTAFGPGALHCESPQIIRITHTVIQQAIRDNASDISLEPAKFGISVRYKVNGSLRDVMQLPKYIQEPLISRFKIMGDLDHTRHNMHQSGHIPVHWGDKDYMLFISCDPAEHGEMVEIRITRG